MALLIAIEGLDGSGKSTLAKELASKMGQDPAFSRWLYQTKEPGLTTCLGNAVFERPGADLRTLALENRSLSSLERELLFYVDASQHRRFIENQGSALFLSDRGLWSHLAYLRACLKSGQISYQDYPTCKMLIHSICAQPHAVIYLRGDLELMKERTEGKKKDVIESNAPSFFTWVLETYEDLAREAYKCLILEARNSTSQNVERVLSWLKGTFSHEQLQTGTF